MAVIEHVALHFVCYIATAVVPYPKPQHRRATSKVKLIQPSHKNGADPQQTNVSLRHAHPLPAPPRKKTHTRTHKRFVIYRAKKNTIRSSRRHDISRRLYLMQQPTDSRPGDTTVQQSRSTPRTFSTTLKSTAAAEAEVALAPCCELRCVASRGNRRRRCC